MAERSKRRRIPKADDVPLCIPVSVPEAKVVQAASAAIEQNPANAPNVEQILSLLRRYLEQILGRKLAADDEVMEQAAEQVSKPGHLAVLTNKYWGAKGVKLGVTFMESTPSDLRNRILSHMNAWGEFCNAHFEWSGSSGEIRITRAESGYWSYLGTDVKLIPTREATMCLQGFSMATSEAEYTRVVRHETGHTLGMPHEHSRREIVKRLDRAKVIAEFMRSQGWSEQTVVQQILTPIQDSSILAGGEPADDESIMAYQFPARLTLDNKPIPGGMNFSALDRKVAGRLYPLEVTPPPPPSGKWRFTEVREVDEETNRVTTISTTYHQ